MSRFLEANLAQLSRRQPELASLVRQAGTGRVRITMAPNGMPTARCLRSDGAAVPLHGSANPLDEARAALGRVDLEGADHVVVLGLGLGYVLDALEERTSPAETRYFVVESDLELLRACFAARDLRRILAFPHVHFAWPPSGPALAEQWRAFFDPVSACRSVFVSHAPSIVLDKPLFEEAVQTIRGQTAQVFTDINTLIGKTELFLANFARNWSEALRAPGVREFAGAGAGRPCVIVSAGPSLDRNIHELIGMEDSLFILAVDTAVRPLLAAGVRSHFVITADPTEENYRHIHGADLSGCRVVAEATGNPGVFEEFRGRIVACAFADSSLHALAALLEDKGRLRAWGSVATMALDFALLLGCNPVIFAGQDLAYSDSRPYCAGVYFEQDWFAGLADPESVRRVFGSILSRKNTFEMPDLHGRPVVTTDRLASYWTWFRQELRRRPDITFINATEGGILKEDVAVMSLREALFRHARPRAGLRAEIDAICSRAPAGIPPGTAPAIDGIRRGADAVAGLLERGLRRCGAAGIEAPGDLLRELDRLKESIYEHRSVAPLLDSLNQMGNIEFLRARKQQARSEPGAAAIREAYAAYFLTVRAALGKLRPALEAISR